MFKPIKPLDIHNKNINIMLLPESNCLSCFAYTKSDAPSAFSKNICPHAISSS